MVWIEGFGGAQVCGKAVEKSSNGADSQENEKSNGWEEEPPISCRRIELRRTSQEINRGEDPGFEQCLRKIPGVESQEEVGLALFGT